MLYTTVTISKVDNGYLVNTQKNVFGEQRPEQELKVFLTFEEVLAFLGPKAVKLKNPGRSTKLVSNCPPP